MKYAFYVIMVLAAYGLGRMMYSSVKPSLLGRDKQHEHEKSNIVTITVDSPVGKVTESIDLANVNPIDFPEKVTLLEGLTVSMPSGLDALALEAGTKVKPVALLAEGLVVQTLVGHQGTISPRDTDFAEGVARKRLENKLTAFSQTTPAPAPPEVATPPAPAPTPANTEVAQTSPPEEPEMTPELAVEKEPAPEPEPAKPTKLTGEQIVEQMKANLQERKLEGFSFEQVKNWQAKPEVESFDGEDFQVGVASYEEETILGKKAIKALALFQEGELVKWVYATTGMEIR